MKILLVIFLAVTIILGLYYLVKSLVFVGFLTVIGIGLHFWISMQKEFDEFGEVTFETKQRLNEILKDKNKIDEFRKYYQNSD